jgi:N-formylglutamate deformylase
MSNNVIWESLHGNGPVVATAIHDGHLLREDVAENMALSDTIMFREEDPFTAGWTSVGDHRIKATHSRFQVDLNRPRDKAVYINPEDAWGLQVWKSKPSADSIAASLLQYDAFYDDVRRIFSEVEKNVGHFVVFDLHSYNFLREGPLGDPADPELNPEVNIGTGTMDRERWAPLVDRFMRDLREYDYRGRSLDVRENVKFKGGQFPRWIHQTFPESACALSIEFKKFFMDEWSGVPDQEQLEEIRLALQSTIPGVKEELQLLSATW